MLGLPGSTTVMASVLFLSFVLSSDAVVGLDPVSGLDPVPVVGLAVLLRDASPLCALQYHLLTPSVQVYCEVFVLVHPVAA